MAEPVHEAKEPAEFVPEEEHAVGILVEEFTEFLDGGIVHHVAMLGRRRGLGHLESVLEVLGRLLAFEGLARRRRVRACWRARCSAWRNRCVARCRS
jgi:hypothetical protein